MHTNIWAIKNFLLCVAAKESLSFSINKFKQFLYSEKYINKYFAGEMTACAYSVVYFGKKICLGFKMLLAFASQSTRKK